MLINTDIAANCFFSAVDDFSNVWAPTVSNLSSPKISGLADGQTYTYYIKCFNASPTASKTDAVEQSTTFQVASAGSATTLIAHHDFEDCTFGPYSPSSTDVDIVDDPTGSGRGKVARIHYVGAYQDKNRNISLDWPTGVGFGKTLYFKGDFFIPADAAFHMRKLFYWQSTNWPNTPVFWAVVGLAGNGGSNDTTYVAASGGADYATNPVTRPGTVSYGVWHTLETQVSIGSSPGASDGIFQEWLDGALVDSQPNKKWTDAAWTASPSQIYFDHFSVGDQVSDTTTTFDEYRYWDNVSFGYQRIQ